MPEPMKVLVEELRDRLAAVRQGGAGGSEAARRKHLDRGKLLVRDRVDRLLDPGSPFLELSPLAATEMYDGAVPRPASSPGSAGWPAVSAWSSPTTPRSRAAPTTR